MSTTLIKVNIDFLWQIFWGGEVEPWHQWQQVCSKFHSDLLIRINGLPISWILILSKFEFYSETEELQRQAREAVAGYYKQIKHVFLIFILVWFAAYLSICRRPTTSSIPCFATHALQGLRLLHWPGIMITSITTSDSMVIITFSIIWMSLFLTGMQLLKSPT